jgi:hypothetical protein
MSKLTWQQAAVMGVVILVVGYLAYSQQTEVASVVTLLGLLWSMFQTPGNNKG